MGRGRLSTPTSGRVDTMSHNPAIREHRVFPFRPVALWMWSGKSTRKWEAERIHKGGQSPDKREHGQVRQWNHRSWLNIRTKVMDYFKKLWLPDSHGLVHIFFQVGVSPDSPAKLVGGIWNTWRILCFHFILDLWEFQVAPSLLSFNTGQRDSGPAHKGVVRNDQHPQCWGARNPGPTPQPAVWAPEKTTDQCPWAANPAAENVPWQVGKCAFSRGNRSFCSSPELLQVSCHTAEASNVNYKQWPLPSKCLQVLARS